MILDVCVIIAQRGKMSDLNTENIEYSYFCVAFIDMLGQKEAFLENGKYLDTIEENISNPEELKKKLGIAHRKTFAAVTGMRKQFYDFFTEYTSIASRPPSSIPEDKIELFKEMRKAHVDLQFFSDCIIASSALRPDKHYATVINSVYGILMSCGGLLLHSLAMRNSFRAGIDVGFGIRIDNKEVYGPAMFRAYEYESQTAQYPRIVVGEQLINFLGNLSERNSQLPNQSKVDIEWCKSLADRCFSMIKVDVDGQAFVDYLGEEMVSGLREDLGNERLKEIYALAFKFIDDEYKRFKELRDQKLAQRYFILRQYFNARKIV